MTIELALKTWYPVGHELHLDPLHPAMKLCGEAGEILDLIAKNMFKPGFSMWNCKYCKHAEEEHVNEYVEINRELFNDVISLLACKSYTPLILDELGDLWYYIRILAYQVDKKLDNRVNVEHCTNWKIERVMQNIIEHSAYILDNVLHNDNQFIIGNNLQVVFDFYLGLLAKLNTDLDTITELNAKKLLGSSDYHGWKNAGKKSE